jgi:hypothetical protein
MHHIIATLDFSFITTLAVIIACSAPCIVAVALHEWKGKTLQNPYLNPDHLHVTKDGWVAEILEIHDESVPPEDTLYYCRLENTFELPARNPAFRNNACYHEYLFPEQLSRTYPHPKA